jgi:glutamate-1-semialdehyde aminotransferase
LIAGVTPLVDRERARFAETHPRSGELHEQARGSLLAGVPMSWMTMWVGAHPVDLAGAEGATVVDVDGNEYVDFCLGDTGAMAGHLAAPAPSAGITTMLPTEDAAWGLAPDAVTLGKSIGGGVPIGAYGVSAELAERIAAQKDADYEDTGGVGGTLAEYRFAPAPRARAPSPPPQPTGSSRSICTCTCSTAGC